MIEAPDQVRDKDMRSHYQAHRQDGGIKRYCNSRLHDSLPAGSMASHGDLSAKQRATKLKRNSCTLGRHALVTHGLGRPNEHPSSFNRPTKQIGIFPPGAKRRVEGSIESL